VEIYQGNADDEVDDGNGGGIHNAGTLSLSNCLISGCAASQMGAGIYSSGSLTLNNCNISDNNTDYLGGGVAIYGSAATLSMTDCTITNNGSGYNGGGLCSTGTSIIADSTISNNLADDPGGGIDEEGGTLTAINCTIAYNDAEDDGSETGGGVCCASGSACDLTNCTIANNITDGYGGGILAQGSVVLNNTVLCGNTDDGGDDFFDVDGTYSGSHNRVSDTSIHLGGLTNNGGPTETMALLSGSDAIDQGDNALIPDGIATDQRGTGHNRIDNGTVDIGAYES
jgi:hypothetical protein